MFWIYVQLAVAVAYAGGVFKMAHNADKEIDEQNRKKKYRYGTQRR